MKKYVIEMNERQAQLLNWACDTLPRLIEGQGVELQDLLEYAWEKRCKEATGKSMDDAWDCGWWKMRGDAEKVVNEIRKRFWGLDVMTENGIHYDDSADIIWDMHQVLRHELWKNSPEPKPRSTVDAFPGTQFGDEPLISVRSYDPEEELEEKIKKVSEAGTWKGVDVDKYMKEVRGEEE